MKVAMSDKSFRNLKWCGIVGVGAVIIAVPYLPGRTEPVTRERLEAARALWQRANITSYDMELETSGAQTGRYHMEVRGGRLALITRNGQSADPAAGEYWTIEGLFRVIEEELDAAEQPQSGAFGRHSQVWLRMRCDSKLGYPIRFVRQVKQASRQTATGYEVPGASLGVELHVSGFKNIF